MRLCCCRFSSSYHNNNVIIKNATTHATINLNNNSKNEKRAQICFTRKTLMPQKVI